MDTRKRIHLTGKVERTVKANGVRRLKVKLKSQVLGENGVIVDESVEVTLNDRDNRMYRFLIGRNALQDRFQVDVSKNPNDEDLVD